MTLSGQPDLKVYDRLLTVSPVDPSTPGVIIQAAHGGRAVGGPPAHLG